MYWKKIMLVGILIGLLGACGAAASEIVDGLGLFVDLEGESNILHGKVNQPVEVYLLMINPSAPDAIAAWECSIVVPDNVTIWGWNFHYPFANCCSPPSFMVVCVDSQPLAPAVLLMTFIVVPQAVGPAPFYVTCGQFDSSGVGMPCYLSDDDVNVKHVLHPLPDGLEEPSLVLFSETVPIDSGSWGEVKHLFR